MVMPDLNSNSKTKMIFKDAFTLIYGLIIKIVPKQKKKIALMMQI